MSNNLHFSLSQDGLGLTINGIRRLEPYILKIPEKASQSGFLKVIFWYFTESQSCRAIQNGSVRHKLNPIEAFFKYLNSQDCNGVEYLNLMLNFNGELTDDFLTLYDTYLQLTKNPSSYRVTFKQVIKTIVTAFINENPDYRRNCFYTPLIDQVFGQKITAPPREPKVSSGDLIKIISTVEQQKKFESDWFISFVFHFPKMLQKIRKDALKVKYVQVLLKELENKQKKDVLDKEYNDFINLSSIRKLSNDYRQKFFLFFESLLKDGSEFLVDCVYHSLPPRLFDDNEEWNELSMEAPLKRTKPNDMNASEWLDFKRNSLQLFRRNLRGRGKYKEVALFGGSRGVKITFSTPFPFSIKHLIRPTETEYIFLRYLLGWHQLTEIKYQNKLNLEDITPFDDSVIRIVNAYKSRTGDIDGLRDIPIEEFSKTSVEYQVLEIYREMLIESYKKYPSVFSTKSINEKLLFDCNKKEQNYGSSEYFGHLFSFVKDFGSGRKGNESIIFYDLYDRYLRLFLLRKNARVQDKKGRNIEVYQADFEKLRTYFPNNLKNITIKELCSLNIKLFNPNTFRLAAQGVVHKYQAHLGRGGLGQKINNKIENEVLAAKHAHSGEMDLQYLIRSRTPYLAEAENIFGEQVASEMIGQAKMAWHHLIEPVEKQLQEQLQETTVWSIYELREYLGISSFEEEYTFKNSEEEAKTLLLSLLEKDDMSVYEGYGHQTLGAIDKIHHRQIIIDTPLTCFLMMHQINFLDDQIESFLIKKITPITDSLDSITLKALVTRAYFSEIVEQKFSQTTRMKAKKLLEKYTQLPPIQL